MPQFNAMAAIMPPSKKPTVDEEKCFHYGHPSGPLRITQTEGAHQDVRRSYKIRRLRVEVLIKGEVSIKGLVIFY